jgi:hypothetical protein
MWRWRLRNFQREHPELGRAIEAALDEAIVEGRLVPVGAGRFVVVDKYDPVIDGEVDQDRRLAAWARCGARARPRL